MELKREILDRAEAAEVRAEAPERTEKPKVPEIPKGGEVFLSILDELRAIRTLLERIESRL